MSDGSIFRVNEFRRIGHPGTVGLSVYGTQASFEEQSGHAGSRSKRRVWVTKDREKGESLDELLDCAEAEAADTGGGMEKVTAADGTHHGASGVHDVSRLPVEFRGLPNGHNGSHQFLVDDFVTACITRRQPANGVRAAARYLVPGLVAHESSLQGGKQLAVPDFGDP
jgi:hypothetical protein